MALFPPSASQQWSIPHKGQSRHPFPHQLQRNIKTHLKKEWHLWKGLHVNWEVFRTHTLREMFLSCHNVCICFCGCRLYTDMFTTSTAWGIPVAVIVKWRVDSSLKIIYIHHQKTTKWCAHTHTHNVDWKDIPLTPLPHHVNHSIMNSVTSAIFFQASNSIQNKKTVVVAASFLFVYCMQATTPRRGRTK